MRILILSVSLFLTLGHSPVESKNFFQKVIDKVRGKKDKKKGRNLNPELSDDEYISKVYQDLLGREPDPGGMEAYRGYLASGNSREAMKENIMKSDEYLSHVRNGTTPEGGTPSVMNGAPDLSNEEFVVAAFNQILGKEPSEKELTKWSGKLDLGTVSREDLVGRLKGSDQWKKRSDPNFSAGGSEGGGGEGGGEAASGDGVVSRNNPNQTSVDRHYTFAARESGSVTIETSGINHRSVPSINGDWEYIFLTLKGEGFGRILLLHAGGNGRAIRYVVEGGGTDTMRMEIASDNLPGWHTWKVTWGGGQLKFFLDGRQIGRTETFTGKPNQAWAGGYPCCGGKRNFLGKWRNFSAK